MQLTWHFKFLLDKGIVGLRWDRHQHYCERGEELRNMVLREPTSGKSWMAWLILGVILGVIAWLTGVIYQWRRRIFSAAIGALPEDERFHLLQPEQPDESLARAANDLVSCFSRLRREEANTPKTKSPRKKDRPLGVRKLVGPHEAFERIKKCKDTNSL